MGKRTSKSSKKKNQAIKKNKGAASKQLVPITKLREREQKKQTELFSVILERFGGIGGLGNLGSNPANGGFIEAQHRESFLYRNGDSCQRTEGKGFYNVLNGACCIIEADVRDIETGSRER